MLKQTPVVLVTSPIANGGGVAVFTELLLDRLSNSFKVDHLMVGARNSVAGKNLEPGTFNAIRRLVTDFFVTVRGHLRHRDGIIHINPSLGLKAVLRDGAFLTYLRLMRFRRVVVFYHGWSPEFAERLGSKGLYRALFRSVFGWVPCTIVLSKTFKDSLVDLGFDADRIHVGATMFDGQAIERIAEPQATDTSEASKEHNLHLLFLSRVERDKGVYELFEAVQELVAEHPNIRLTIAGDGRALPDLRQRVEDAGLSDVIKLPGYVTSPEEKAKLMQDANVFCLPSTHGEGMPVSLLEGMGAGLAVVSTKVGGIPEVCDEQGAILLSEPSTAAVTAALRKLQENPDYCRALGAHNRALAWQEYEASVVVGRLELMYDSLIDRADRAVATQRPVASI